MKRILTVLLTVALLVTMAVPAFANDGTVTMYTTTTTNAYVSPNASSKVLATFPAGKDVVTYPVCKESSIDRNKRSGILHTEV